MSEEAVVLESAAPPEVQAKAEKLGWIPPTRYKGDAERFIDAEEFIQRGETVLPIVKKQLADRNAELDLLRRQTAEQAAALERANKAIADIEERHSVATQKAVEQARKDLKAELAAASAAGDHEMVAEITDKMTQLNTAEAETKPAKAAEPAKFTPDPAFVEWQKENDWFGVDKRKTAFLLGIAQDMRDSGDKRLGRDFYDAALEEMNKELGVKQTTRIDKVEGGRSGGGAEDVRGGKKGYANLPAEAKAACDADIRRFVGDGKKYKTPAEWRARFAEMYFEE